MPCTFRDLKSDNLLLEWTEGHPHLVLSDFGHCLAGQLVMPYPNDCMDKGGNGKLMAPEVTALNLDSAKYLKVVQRILRLLFFKHQRLMYLCV